MRSTFLPLLTMMLALSCAAPAPALAQTSSTGLTGAWNVTVAGPDGTAVGIILLTCHADGTVVAVLPGFGDSPGTGTWVAAENGRFALTTLHFDLNPPPDPNPVYGFLKVRANVSVSGATMTGSIELVLLDLTGVVRQNKGFIGTLTATPIAVEPVGAP